MTSVEPGVRWQAALAYALVGPPVRDLRETGTPDVSALLDDLGGISSVRERVRSARQSGEWPYRIPFELRDGLGAAQYAAAWSAVLAALGPGAAANARAVVTDRALTAEERRLVADRPPHHGG